MVMVAGRHRELPVALDRAVELPKVDKNGDLKDDNQILGEDFEYAENRHDDGAEQNSSRHHYHLSALLRITLAAA